MKLALEFCAGGSRTHPHSHILRFTRIVRYLANVLGFSRSASHRLGLLIRRGANLLPSQEKAGYANLQHATLLQDFIVQHSR